MDVKSLDTSLELISGLYCIAYRVTLVVIYKLLIQGL